MSDYADYLVTVKLPRELEGAHVGFKVRAAGGVQHYVNASKCVTLYVTAECLEGAQAYAETLTGQMPLDSSGVFDEYAGLITDAKEEMGLAGGTVLKVERI